MNESPTLTGKIIVLSETQNFPSGFQKREFVIETNEKYPQKIKFEAIKDGCARLDSYNVGDELTVSYNLRGNEHNGKYYISAQAWKFERVGEASSRKSTTAAPRGRSPNQDGAAPPPAPAADDDEERDEVPF